MCADLFKLANVVILFCLRGHERPKLLDLVAFHIEQARSLRGIKPFMQARTKVVAAKVFVLEVKLRKRMSTVNDSLDSLCARHIANRFHWRDLAGDVHLMRNEDELRSICN